MILLLAQLATAGPTIEGGVGVGLLGPLSNPGSSGPAVSVEVAATELVPTVAGFGVVSNVDAAMLPCPECPWRPTARFGFGPQYRTRYVDVAAELRAVVLSNVRLQPAIGLTGHVPAGGLDVQPYLIADGLQFTDLSVGVRLGFEVDDDGLTIHPHETQASQVCEEGDWRLRDEPSLTLELTGPTGPPEVDIEPAGGNASSDDEETRNALGRMAKMISDALFLRGLGNVSAALLSRSTNGRTGITLANAASRQAGNPIVVPTNGIDAIPALTANALKLAQAAVTGLMKMVDERNMTVVEVTAKVPMETITMTCQPMEVCVAGAWVEQGWFNDPAKDVVKKSVKIIPGTLGNNGLERGRDQIRAAVGRIMTQFSRLDYARMMAFEQADNPCAVVPGYADAVEAYEAEVAAEAEAEAKRKADCARYARQQSDLQGERRALVGPAPGLEAEQLEWQSDHEARECTAAEVTARFWEEHAAKRAELAALTGDADVASDAEQVAGMAAERAEAWKNQCERAEEVAEAADRLGESMADAPARIDAIDAELAELESALADCD